MDLCGVFFIPVVALVVTNFLFLRFLLLLQLALSSLLSYNELSDSLAEGYMLVLGSTKEQSQGYVEKKYGKNAKQVVGDSTAAVINVGHAALVTRRVISVKKVLTSNVKYIAKKKVENFSESARQKSSQVEK